ncbi:MAG TPA: hypothetical protein VFD07_00810 [Candidatus Krumholzibacteria bacterium]|nr:hypothetical protein [Candidatus Krumholzibacteria bacterium]
MLRKVMFGCLLCAGLAGSASAQEKAMDLEVSAEFLSKYIWNGFDRIRDLGLDTGPVLQPKISLGMGNTPLHATVGGSFVMNDDSELHETTYGVYVERYSSPLTRLGFGYTYYDDRIEPLPGTEDGDAHEIWAGLHSRNPGGMRTAVDVKYEMSARERYDSFFFASGEFAYMFPLIPPSGTGMGLDLEALTRILYNTGIESQGIETVRSGMSAWQMGLAAELRAARVLVKPSLQYQVTLEDSVNDENPLWGGISVAYTF